MSTQEFGIIPDPECRTIKDCILKATFFPRLFFMFPFDFEHFAFKLNKTKLFISISLTVLLPLKVVFELITSINKQPEIKDFIFFVELFFLIANFIVASYSLISSHNKMNEMMKLIVFLEKKLIFHGQQPCPDIDVRVIFAIFFIWSTAIALDTFYFNTTANLSFLITFPYYFVMVSLYIHVIAFTTIMHFICVQFERLTEALQMSNAEKVVLYFEYMTTLCEELNHVFSPTLLLIFTAIFFSLTSECYYTLSTPFEMTLRSFGSLLYSGINSSALFCIVSACERVHIRIFAALATYVVVFLQLS